MAASNFSPSNAGSHLDFGHTHRFTTDLIASPLPRDANRYRGIYKNIGDPGDYERLFRLNPSYIQEGDPLLSMLNDLVAFESLNPEGCPDYESRLDAYKKIKEVFETAMEGLYRSGIKREISRQIRFLAPDFFCLSEVNLRLRCHHDTIEGQGVIQELEKHGYTCTLHHDTNIAWSSRFTHLSTLRRADGAISVNLFDTLAQRVILVTSDHVAGFRVDDYLQKMEIIKSPDATKETIAEATKAIEGAAEVGNVSIKQTLAQIDSALLDQKSARKTFKTHLNIYQGKKNAFDKKAVKLFSKQPTPPAAVQKCASILFYAGDFNVNNDDIYPQRLNLLKAAGYVSFPFDTEGTVEDHRIRVIKKYDHAFVRATNPTKIALRIFSGPILQTGDIEYAVSDYRFTPSDHLAIYFDVEVTTH